MTADTAMRVADHMRTAGLVFSVFVLGFVARTWIMERMTYELSTGQYVVLEEWAGTCRKLQDEIAKGSTVQTTSPWGTVYAVSNVYCSERPLP